MPESIQDKQIKVQASKAYASSQRMDDQISAIINQVGGMVSKASGNPVPRMITQLSTNAYKAAKYGM